MTRTHLKIICEAEASQLLSEKLQLERSVTKVTLTSSWRFAANKLADYDRKVILR